VFVKLPPSVAKLGKVGMKFRGIDFICIRSVWRPVGPDRIGDDIVCANVYPLPW
jgi:hypothetical protein|tara:strand:+ start:1656 stop:1817 length:162 start_codon:yes stop_codon:yes gene_type:complete